MVHRGRLARDRPRPAAGEGRDQRAQRDPRRARGHRRQQGPGIGDRLRLGLLPEDVIPQKEPVPPGVLGLMREIDNGARVAVGGEIWRMQGILHLITSPCYSGRSAAWWIAIVGRWTMDDGRWTMDDGS